MRSTISLNIRVAFLYYEPRKKHLRKQVPFLYPCVIDISLRQRRRFYRRRQISLCVAWEEGASINLVCFQNLHLNYSETDVIIYEKDNIRSEVGMLYFQIEIWR